MGGGAGFNVIVRLITNAGGSRGWDVVLEQFVWNGERRKAKSATDVIATVLVDESFNATLSEIA